VQASSSSGVAGALTTVQFVVQVVDTSAPVVTSITATILGPESVRVSYTLTDQSTIVSIRCRIDDGPYFECGSGTSGSIVLNDLVPGEHTVDVYGVDILGNTGGTTQPSAPPSTTVRVTFTST
jgi:hypothetical protein